MINNGKKVQRNSKWQNILHFNREIWQDERSLLQRRGGDNRHATTQNHNSLFYRNELQLEESFL